MSSLSFQMANSLSYHKPNAEQLAKIEHLRDAQKTYAATLEKLCPPGRELAIAKTEFETSSMWAVKALVIEDAAEREYATQEGAAARLGRDLSDAKGPALRTMSAVEEMDSMRRHNTFLERELKNAHDALQQARSAAAQVQRGI